MLAARGVLAALVAISLSTSTFAAEPAAGGAPASPPVEEPERVGDALVYTLAATTMASALVLGGVTIGWHVTRKDADGLRDDLEARAGGHWLPCLAGGAELQTDCDELVSLREREHALGTAVTVTAIGTIALGSAFLGYLGYRVSEYSEPTDHVAVRPTVGPNGASLAVEVAF